MYLLHLSLEHYQVCQRVFKQPGNQTNLAGSCLICSADKVWLPLVRDRPTNHNHLSNMRRDKYDDGADECLEPFSTTKMATAGIERSVDSTIETALI